MDILTQIVDSKKEEVRSAVSRVPLADLKQRCRDLPRPRPFFNALAKPGPSGVNIIAEIKRKSPSKGPLNPGLDPGEYAVEYAKGGACALSVLTDHPYFGGAHNDLRTARAAVQLPALRKDFLISEYQIYESRTMGADAILLICRILTPHQCQELLALSRELGMDALVEIHTETDLDTALSIDARLVGINNRNLASFETDIRTAATLTARLHPSQIPVAASGIQSRTDIELSLKAGIFNFLVGESLVRTKDPARLLAALQGLPASAIDERPSGGKP